MKHRKLLTWLSAALVGIAAAAAFSAGMTAEASTGSQTVNNIYYSYDTETHTAKVTGCADSLIAANIVSSFRINGTSQTVNVTEIDTGAFKSKRRITSVSIPDSIHVIGNDAFWGTSITSVSIPDGVTVINENTFRDTKLTSVSIPGSVTSIGDRAFMDSPLAAVTIPNSVKKIGYFAFSSTALQTVTVPANVEELTYGAFFFCQSLNTVKIKGATKVGAITFEGCSALKNVSLSNQIPYIGREAFMDCTALESITIPGATELQYHAFKNCTELKSVSLSDASYTSKSWTNSHAFYNCPKLFQVNGVNALQYRTDSNGIQYPVINPNITTALNNHFRRSINVGFVDAYCSELCKYIVKTETGYDPDGPAHQTSDWMNDALKARQLHDWLVRHCKREDGANGENNGDIENQIASSVFLSYAVNERGEGIGESICAGLSKAYTMLLATAGIESYFIDNGGHAWNLVKIGDKYYHTDILRDINYYNFDFFTPKNECCTCYEYFLKSTMEANTNIHQSVINEHPLLMIYTNDISNRIKSCNENYPDTNKDGILDYDYNLNGKNMFYTDFLHDSYALYYMQQYVYVGGTMDQINDMLADTLYYWHYQLHASFERFIFNYYGCQE